MHQTLELAGNVLGASLDLHLFQFVVSLELPRVALASHECCRLLLSHLSDDLLLLEQALSQLIHSIEVPDDLELFGPFLDDNLKGFVLLFVLALVCLDLLKLGFHLLHPPQMLKVDLKVLLGLLLFVLKEVTFEVQLVLPARPLSLDDEPMVRVHALHG